MSTAADRAAGPPGAVYDRTTRRWRHLDLGAARLYLEAESRRLACRRCGRVRTETVPWARPGARSTRDFEEVVAWLAQHTDKTTITRLLRCSWAAVAAITVRVADHLDEHRLDGLYRIGIDEVSYRKGHRYLTVVADHDHDRDGAVVWAAEGKSGATLERFYDALGSERTAQLTAASMDLHGAHAKVTATHAPQARVCANPFHVVKLANHALDEVRRAEWNSARHAAKVSRPSPIGRVRQDPAAQLVKHTRWALLKDPARWTTRQRQLIEQLRRARHVLFRAWVLKEELRDLYRLPAGHPADRHLDAWLARASRSRIPAMLALSRTIRAPPRRDPRRGRPRAVQQQARRAQQQDPTDQPPRLRPPLRHRPHRNDLPVLLRPDHHPPHSNVRRTTRSPRDHVGTGGPQDLTIPRHSQRRHDRPLRTGALTMPLSPSRNHRQEVFSVR
jgi:transposase